MDGLDVERCVICGGEGMELGALGRLDWYRCRNCGQEWPVEREGVEE